PGGLAVVTLDNPRNPLVALRNALPFRPLVLVPYYVGATLGPRGLGAALESVGFAVEELAAVMHVPRIAARALRPPLRLLLVADGQPQPPEHVLVPVPGDADAVRHTAHGVERVHERIAGRSHVERVDPAPVGARRPRHRVPGHHPAALRPVGDPAG